jgi:hypothetical protein
MRTPTPWTALIVGMVMLAGCNAEMSPNDVPKRAMPTTTAQAVEICRSVGLEAVLVYEPCFSTMCLKEARCYPADALRGKEGR